MPPAISTLAELVAPQTQADFVAQLQERKLAFMRTEDAGRYRSLMNWETLLGMLERGEHPRGLADVRLVRDSLNIPSYRWFTRSGANREVKIDLAKVEEFMAQGHSLIVTPIQAYFPPLTTLCADIAAQTSEETKVAVVVTNTLAGGAFKIHYDPEDTIILQVEGTKRWRLYGPVVVNPVVGMPKPMPPAQKILLLDEFLRPGDFLFVPAGTWHVCESGPDRSMHLGISLVPPTGWHAVKSLASSLVGDELLRKPLTRHGEGERAALETAIRKRLVEAIDQFDLHEFMKRWGKGT